MSERLLDHCSLQLLGDGRGFAMEVSGGASEPQRLELPVWMLHQLMRSLPHLDAALQQGQGHASSAVMAYPVLDWSVNGSLPDAGVTLWLRNERHVDAGFHLGLDEAIALHRELGLSISQAAAPAIGDVSASNLN